MRVAGLAASAAHIQVGLKAVTLWPDSVEHVKPCLGNRGFGLFEQAFRTPGFGQHNDDFFAHSAGFGQLAGQRQCRAKIVHGSTRGQEHHVTLAADIFGQLVCQSPRVHDHQVIAFDCFAQFFQTLECAGFNLRLDAVAQPQGTPLHTGELLQIEVTDQHLVLGTGRRYGQHAGQGAFAHTAFLSHK